MRQFYFTCSNCVMFTTILFFSLGDCSTLCAETTCKDTFCGFGKCPWMSKCPLMFSKPRNSSDKRTECSWRIFGPTGRQVQLNFYYIILESINETLSIYDGDSESSPRLKRFKNVEIDFPFSIVSTGNSLYVKLISDPQANSKGFTAQWCNKGRSGRACLLNSYTFCD